MPALQLERRQALIEIDLETDNIVNYFWEMIIEAISKPLKPITQQKGVRYETR
jgi:hypothetical protein